MNQKINKLIAIVGPTASGKTDLAIFLASTKGRPSSGWKGFELISADSRQVYKGMDIGTGKNKSYPQHLIDICDPKTQYSVAEFQKDAYKTIYEVFKRKNIPIMVGGTGLYIDSVLKGYKIPKTSLALRDELDKLCTDDLLKQLKGYDLTAYINIDHHNRRRLLRALEASIVNRRPLSEYKAHKPKFEALVIGTEVPRVDLYKNIDSRVDERIKAGMIEETQALLEKGITHERLQRYGLEYRFIDNYLQNILTKPEMIQKLKFAIHDFARRQLTWFRKNKEICWVKDHKEASILVKKFLNYEK